MKYREYIDLILDLEFWEVNKEIAEQIIREVLKLFEEYELEVFQHEKHYIENMFAGRGTGKIVAIKLIVKGNKKW